MRHVKIIALCGYKQSGKTTACNHIQGDCYLRLRFADKIKEILRVLEVPVEYVDGGLKEEQCDELCGRTARYAMQTLGTEWGRRLIDEDIWIKQLKIKMDYWISAGVTNFVIDDLRFLNEEKWLKSLVFAPYNYDVEIIRIRRDNTIFDNHQSEAELDQIVEDWTIFNNSTVEDMYKSLDDIIGGGIK